MPATPVLWLFLLVSSARARQFAQHASPATTRRLVSAQAARRFRAASCALMRLTV